MEGKLAIPFMRQPFHMFLQLQSFGTFYLFVCFIYIQPPPNPPPHPPTTLTPPVMWSSALARDRLLRRPFLFHFCLRFFLRETEGKHTTHHWCVDAVIFIAIIASAACLAVNVERLGLNNQPCSAEPIQLFNRRHKEKQTKTSVPSLSTTHGYN